MSKFKVGDKVYYPNRNWKLVWLESNESDRYPLRIVGDTFTEYGKYIADAHVPSLFHATKENHAALSTLFPEIQFELPPLTNNEIVQNMLKEGKPVMCYLSDDSYDMAVFKGIYGLVASYDADEGFDAGGEYWQYVVPMTYSDVMAKIGFVQE